jgi:hypothetical protein
MARVRSLIKYANIADRLRSTLLIGLLLTAAFLAVTILPPLIKILSSGFCRSAAHIHTLSHVPGLSGHHRQYDLAGRAGGDSGTALGFLFAFVEVRVAVPGNASCAGWRCCPSLARPCRRRRYHLFGAAA